MKISKYKSNTPKCLPRILKRALLAALGGTMLWAAPFCLPPGAQAATTGQTVTIGKDSTLETLAGAPPYTVVVLGEGAIWRPMDGTVGTLINNGSLTTGENSIIDLTWRMASTPALKTMNGTTLRTMNPTIADGTTLRIAAGSNKVDMLQLLGAVNLHAGTTQATMYVEVGYIKDIRISEGGSTSNVNVDWASNPAVVVVNASPKTVVQLQNLADVDKIVVLARPGFMDTPLTKYWVDFEIDQSSTNPRAWQIGNIVATNQSGSLSESGLSAGDSQLAMRNLWRMDNGSLWQRTGELRRSHTAKAADGGSLEGEAHEDVWANLTRGKYHFASGYGRDFTQSYDAVAVGFDKARQGDFYNGRLYEGFFLSLLDSDARYFRGTGELESKSIGAYSSWQGNNNHFLDLMLRFSKLDNKFNFTDTQSYQQADYGNWIWSVGAQYGRRKDLASGWFVEPSAGLNYGLMGKTSYELQNGLTVHQGRVPLLSGRLELLAGRATGSKDNPASLYAKASLNHNFTDGGNMIGTYGNASLPIEPVGRDTWTELTLGANKQISDSSHAYAEVSKSFGGKVDSDWQVNAGLSWRFNGPSAQPAVADFGTSASAPAADMPLIPVMDESKAVGESAKTATGHSVTSLMPIGAARPSLPERAEPAGQAGQALQPEMTVSDRGTADAARTEIPVIPADNDMVTAVAGEPGDYALAPLVVEAPRPEWEKNLSPGTVSVVRPDDYKGEMKTLPELLQTVPGVYIHKANGEGHYTVARVRGSTGGQVNVYLDGVLINSASEVAVDLSIIPVENVERVEVYRGYVPARFAGAPLGGAINIITKKPQDTGGSVTQGWRSFDGYTGNLELNMPLGDGSLLFGVNRDQARGDFKYRHVDGAGGYPAFDKWRQGNEFRKTDALLKWQDDHWLVKAAYKRDMTGSMGGANSYMTDAVNGYPIYGENYRYKTTRRMEIDDYSLLIGRRQTTGNLEWGWRMDYGYNKKHAYDPAERLNTTPAGWKYSIFRNTRQGLALDGSWKMGDSHLLEFYANYMDEDMRTRYSNLWTPQLKTHVDADYFIDRYDIKKYYLQLQDTITLNRSRDLKFVPLVRREKQNMTTNANGGDGKWRDSFNLALQKDINDNLTVRSSYGTYHRYPNFFEIFGDGYYVVPAPLAQQYGSKITVEHGKQWDIGVSARGRALGAATDTTLTYFNRDVQDLSSYAVDPSGRLYYVNAGAGIAEGLELEHSMKWERWDLLAAVTRNHTEITERGPQTFYSVGKRIVGVPQWESNIRLNYRFPGEKLSMFGEYHYVGETTQGRNSTSTYEALGLFNAGVKYSANSRLNLSFGVNDIFNKGPEQTYTTYSSSTSETYNVTFPLQGRTYYMTAQYLF